MRTPPPSPRGISLRETLPEAAFGGAADIRVTRCTADAQRCRAGDLFVSLADSGWQAEGELREAALRGAAAVLTEEPFDDLALPTCQVSDVRSAYGRVCQALAGYPAQRMRVMAVTGGAGRTTTALLAASVLESAGYRPGVMCALGHCDGQDHQSVARAIPRPPALAAWMARMAAHGCTHAVLEVSPRALAEGRLAGIEFDLVCRSDAKQDQRQASRRAGRRDIAILDYLSADGLTVANADAPHSRRFLSCIDGPAVTVGIERPAEISATVVERQLSEQTFLLNTGELTLPVRTQLIGEQNIYHCLLAAAIGMSYGLDPVDIIRGLEAVERIPGRLERLECGQPFGVVVDAARSPRALTTALRTLRGLSRGRLICVFGSAGHDNRLRRADLGRAVEELADLAIVTSNNPRDEDPREIATDVLRGVRRRAKFVELTDRSEAIAWTLAQALPGDCVLIAGQGECDRQIVADGAVYFDDREFACQCLYAGASSRLRLRTGA